MMPGHTTSGGSNTQCEWEHELLEPRSPTWKVKMQDIQLYLKFRQTMEKFFSLIIYQVLMGYTYSQNIICYLKFKFNWMAYVLSGRDITEVYF